MMFFLLTQTFYSFLVGNEKVDVKPNFTFSEYLKSKLFSLPSLQIIQNSVYIIILAIVLLIESNPVNEIDLVIHWSIIALITQIPLSVYFGYLVKKNFVLTLEWTRIAKYLLVSVGMFALSYVLYDKYLVYNTDLIQFIPNLLLFIAVGVIGYLAITYLIDSKIRILFNAIFSEIKRTKQ